MNSENTDTSLEPPAVDDGGGGDSTVMVSVSVYQSSPDGSSHDWEANSSLPANVTADDLADALARTVAAAARMAGPEVEMALSRHLMHTYSTGETR